jgi:hypothetical protein
MAINLSDGMTKACHQAVVSSFLFTLLCLVRKSVIHDFCLSLLSLILLFTVSEWYSTKSSEQAILKG